MFIWIKKRLRVIKAFSQNSWSGISGLVSIVGVVGSFLPPEWAKGIPTAYTALQWLNATRFLWLAILCFILFWLAIEYAVKQNDEMGKLNAIKNKSDLSPLKEFESFCERTIVYNEKIISSTKSIKDKISEVNDGFKMYGKGLGLVYKDSWKYTQPFMPDLATLLGNSNPTHTDKDLKDFILKLNTDIKLKMSIAHPTNFLETYMANPKDIRDFFKAEL